MPLTLPVNTVAECLRTDCYIPGDLKKKQSLCGREKFKPI